MNTPYSHKLLLTALTACCVTGCENDYDPASRVTDLRVLAVQADTPFAAPGQAVQVTALAYDPEQRPITWAWGLCDGAEDSSVSGCIARFVELSEAHGSPPWLAVGEGQASAGFTIPDDALERLPAEARWQAEVGVLSVACPGDLRVVDDGLEIPFACTDSTTGRELEPSEYVVGVKRVYVRSSDQNQNPEIERVLFDGDDWPVDEIKEVDSCDTDTNDYTVCKGNAKHRVAAIVSPASFESGTDEYGRDFSEQLVIQHYSTEGIFEGEVRVADDPTTGWVARRRASGSEITLWFVARDDRGGVGWAERRVHVR